MANPVRRIIINKARKYNVNPKAALAVAMGEGGVRWGAVGDNGTSFGPFQLHIGGALPRGKGAAWANSPAGIDYAIRSMARAGAKGLGPRAAVNAIVRRFERPADPDTSVRNALARLDDIVVPAGAGRSPGTNRRAARPQEYMRATMNAGENSKMQLAMQLISNLQLVASGQMPQPIYNWNMDMTADAPNGRRGVTRLRRERQRAGGDARILNTGYAYPLGRRGKLNGTPYGGTHTIGNWQSDNAIDINVPVGTPVFAPADGIVGSRWGSLGQGGRFAGLRINIETPGNKRVPDFYLAHLSKLVAKPGQRVRKGQVIGYSGSAAGVPHLHMGVSAGNPMKMFGFA